MTAGLRSYPELPPKVEYALTPMSDDLRGVIEAVKAFGEKYKN